MTVMTITLLSLFVLMYLILGTAPELGDNDYGILSNRDLIYL